MEPQEKSVNKPVKETPSSQRARGSQRMTLRQQLQSEKEEEREEEGEAEEEVLSQSLQKRNKNIQENKAMVIKPLFDPYSNTLCYISFTCDLLCGCVQLAKLFADLSTMADLTPPTTPRVSIRTNNKRLLIISIVKH